MRRVRIFLVVGYCVGSLTSFDGFSYDVSPELSVGVTLSAGAQNQWISSDLPVDDYGAGAAGIVQPEVAWRPWAAGEFFAKLGFALGNGINQNTPFYLAPWAADLEDDVKNLNGRSRDYVLTASYRHSFDLGSGGALDLYGGILDSTDFLDANEFANDETTQFMNEVFVNSGSYGLPSYDYGLASDWSRDAWTVNAVLMWVGENDDGNAYLFGGVQIGRRHETSWGVGNIRLNLAGTDSEFVDTDGSGLVRRAAWGLSVDQELGDTVGGFLRVAWQTDETFIDFSALYSGGLEFQGRAWKRDNDRLGLGLAWLSGGNSIADGTFALESYYRFNLTESFSLTADIQFMEDRNRGVPGWNGWVLGLRTTAVF